MRDGHATAVGVLALALAALVLAWFGAPAEAKVRDVRPGNDALQRAIDRARAGDVLRLHGRRYREAVIVDKRLKLKGVGKRRPVIDGLCETGFTVAVQASGVVLKRLKVVGAGEGLAIHPSEVDFRSVDRGKAKDLVVKDTCGGEAEYGINVLDSGRVTVADSRASGFTDAGIYVGSITDTGDGALVVRRNEAFGNTVGIIVEFSAGGEIRVFDNDVHDNTLPGPETEPTGIWVFDSEEVTFSGNRVTGSGRYGIHLTRAAARNRLDDNVITGNPIDVLDEGFDNCGTGNVIGSGDPIPPC